MIKNKENTKHYKLVDNGDGWHLVETNTLSIFQEIIPENTSEKLHYHGHAQQFFFILKDIPDFSIYKINLYIA